MSRYQCQSQPAPPLESLSLLVHIVALVITCCVLIYSIHYVRVNNQQNVSNELNNWLNNELNQLFSRIKCICCEIFKLWCIVVMVCLYQVFDLNNQRYQDRPINVAVIQAIDWIRNKTFNVARMMNRLPVHQINNFEGMQDKECVICIQEYRMNDHVKTLPCFHFYHVACIDEWLINKPLCPVCKQCIHFH
eukprot:22631_1